jgi:hypothetical protein
MKKIFLTIMLFSILLLSSYSQSGKNCFNTQFHKDATALDPMNGYLLGYLCTMTYPDYFRFWYPGVPGYGLKGDSVKYLQAHDDDFVEHYANKLGFLFVDKDQAPTFTLASDNLNLKTTDLVNTSISKLITGSTVDQNVAVYKVPNGQTAVFDFENKCNPGGYDPEAILISTPTTIYVVFRGTDRVACNTPGTFAYEWNEWLASDFQFLKRPASVMNVNIQGNVHRGMVESLLYQGFADSLASRIKRFGGANKKVWITGHSLGGAHAQLFAMFLRFNYQITPQGVYTYESPHPGDQTFVNQFNNVIGKTHIQRFEFGDDPICTLPPQAFLFARAGERNYFADYTSTNLRSEQTFVDDGKILCALGNLPSEQIPQSASFVFPPVCPGSTCYHHPTLILQAARHLLATSILSLLPPAIPLPTAGDNCTTGDLTKAQNNDLINNTATAVENTIATVLWQAGNVTDNLLGTGLTEGNYRIACYGFKNNSKKYLNWDGTVDHQLKISNTGTVFTITHKATGGYQIWSFSGNMAADVNYTLGAPNGSERTNNVIMKSKDFIVGDEETWYFFKVPNNTNTFVIYNWNSHKVIDANANCLSSNTCDVNESNAASNDATQVWVLEKVN